MLLTALELSTAFLATGPSLTVRTTPTSRLHASTSSWSDLESKISYRTEAPSSIDSVLDPETPTWSDVNPTFFRERHGWCPYSERVWLAAEILNVELDTIRIDNTGGGAKPSYWDLPTTPQMMWPGSGQVQGESMDLVAALDTIYGDGTLHVMGGEDVQAKFFDIFPSNARPSSRAAFLFQGNGGPLSKATFEGTLEKTNELLKEAGGPFFLGNNITAADIAWAPFLERYRYQLPCLHPGLDPNDAKTYPQLHAWYEAMEKEVPEYACRIKGNGSSWRKVLLMAGFGNGGDAPAGLEDTIEELEQEEAANAADIIDQSIWDDYASTRSYLAKTPHAEAGAVIIKNRVAIMEDAKKRGAMPNQELEDALQELALTLLNGETSTTNDAVKTLAAFLDERMCVPRDMGAMSAAAIKLIAHSSS